MDKAKHIDTGRKTIGMKVSKEYYEKIKLFAARRNISITNLFKQAINEYMDKPEEEVS